MTVADLPLGLRLKAQAGWNQLEADWRRALDLQPDGCFVAELDGAPAGTVATCVFGPVAWVALVLVDAELRGRGIGTALMRRALDYLETEEVRSVRLDATPLGRPVYEKLGFVAQFTLHRFEGILPPGDAVPGIVAVSSDGYEELLRLDRRITGTDRGRLLRRLFAEQPEAVRGAWRDDDLEGYLTVRQGANAVQIGPCLATNAEAGRLLLSDAQRCYAGHRVFIDVPVDNRAAAAAVGDMGLTVQRPFLRMSRGELIVEQVEQLWTSGGPEKG
jgi:GNAT superfamily N-acetyltransferase